MTPPAIQVLDVVKRFGQRTVLDHIRLDVQQGETLVILGGSGSGKSTLLRLMVGILPFDEGDIIGLGKSLSSMSAADLMTYRKSVGVLFQSGALFNSMSVANNVAPPAINTRKVINGQSLNVSPEPREMNVDVSISSVYSLGGQNAALVFKKV